MGGRARWIAALATATAVVLSGVVAVAAVASPAEPGAAVSTVTTDPCAPVGPTAPGHARCFALAEQRIVTDARTGVRRAAGASSTPTGITPAQLRKVYGVSTLTAPAGTTVAVVDAYDAPNVETDLSRFRTRYSLGDCTTANGCFRKVDQRGAVVPASKGQKSTVKPVYNSAWQLEITLDVEAVSAMCPSCNILLVEADDTSLVNSLGPAVALASSLGATVISNSFGSGESADESAAEAQFWSQAGVPVFAATGDEAWLNYDKPSTDGSYGFADFPAVSPSVVAVGGTSMTLNGTTVTAESAWSNAGSGCSQVFRRPSWQSAYFTGKAIDPDPFETDALFGCNIPGQGVTPARATADLAAIADPGAPGFPVYLGGAWVQAGGTSLAAPLMAALAAYAGPRGTDTPVTTVAYGLAQLNAPTGLSDITTGTNKPSGFGCDVQRVCTARTNWDGPTGLGTPRGLSVFAPLLTLTPSTSVPGGAVTASGSDFVPGETLTLTSGGTVLATTTANADGSWSTPVTVPPTAAGPVTVTVAGATSGFTASRTVTLGAPLIAAAGAAAPAGQVVPLEPVTARVANFGAGETVRFTISGSGANPVDVTSNPAGGASTTLTVPPGATGSVTVTAVGRTSGIRQSTTLNVVGLSVSPGYQVVRAGTAATLVVAGYGSGETLTATVDRGTGPGVVATGTASVNGVATLTWTPDGSTPGTKRVVVAGATTGATGAVLVDVLTATGTPPAVPTVLSVTPTRSADGTATGVVVGVRVAPAAPAATTVTVNGSDGSLSSPVPVSATGDAFVSVTGLTPGASYTFKAIAGNAAGDSLLSSASASVTTTMTSGVGDLVPVGPVRLLDSRDTNTPLGQGEVRRVPVAGRAGVPAGAAAVVVSLTVLTPSTDTFLTLWPGGEPLPNVSNANVTPAVPYKASLARVKLGPDGSVNIANRWGIAGFILDIVGYYAGAAPVDGTAGDQVAAHSQSYGGLPTPVRVADTRTVPNSPVRGHAGIFTVPIRDGVAGVRTGVPADATSVELEVQAVDSTALGFLTVYPTGLTGGVPNVSNAQFSVGHPTDTSVVATIGADGTVSVFANAGTEVIVDIVGYYAPSAAGRFVPVSPRRYVDSRPSQGGGGPLGTNSSAAFAIAGAPALDGSVQVPATASTVSFSMVATDNSMRTWMTAWDGSTPRPAVTSLLPDPASGIYDNLVLSALGLRGTVSVWNFIGSVNVIIDVQGYYTTTPPSDPS